MIRDRFLVETYHVPSRMLFRSFSIISWSKTLEYMRIVIEIVIRDVTGDQTLNLFEFITTFIITFILQVVGLSALENASRSFFLQASSRRFTGSSPKPTVCFCRLFGVFCKYLVCPGTQCMELVVREKREFVNLFQFLHSGVFWVGATMSPLDNLYNLFFALPCHFQYHIVLQS